MSSRVMPGRRAGSASRVEWRRMGPNSDAANGSDGDESREEARTEETEAREAKARAEGRERGIQEGFAQGQAAAREEFSQRLARECDEILARVAQSVEQTTAFRLRIRQQMEEDLVQLAIAVARRILHRELQVDPEALLGVVKAAVGKIGAREILRCRVCAQDAPILERHFAGLHLAARVELVADAGLPRGSVIVDTTRGQMDASIETQLDEIGRGFSDLVRRG